jgi:hypothetical protein
MTAKEQAEYLHRLYYIILCESVGSAAQCHALSKKCAWNCVNQILEIEGESSVNEAMKGFIYWTSVKEEIEKI